MKKMKIKDWCCVFGFVLTAVSAYPQFVKDSGPDGPGSSNLQIGYSKTTSIVFQYPIKSIDRGSQDIISQKAKGVENVLLVKAGKPNFQQSNITVVTADAKLYHFILNYDEQSPDLNVVVGSSAAVNREILFSLENENQQKIEQYATLALFKKKKTENVKRSKYDIKLELTGVSIHQDILYFRFCLGNASKINYDIDQLRFFIRDQRKSKRTASQEIEVLPLHATSAVTVIPDRSEVHIAYALSKFTIPEKKYLSIQLIEKNGGRQLELNLKNRDLNNPDVLNHL